jgi:hypothetical protein
MRRQAIEMKQPPNNAPLPNDFALKILTLLRCGGVSRSELTQQLQPRPSKKALSAHLEQLERLQLVVRESTGSTDRRWIDGDAVLALSASLARCIEGLTEADKAFVRGLSARMEAVLHRRKLFNSPERIIILNEIAQAPRDIHYIWNK